MSARFAPQVVPNVKRETLQTEVLNNVKYGSKIYSDDAVAYDGLKEKYIHEVVNHAEELRSRTGSHKRPGKFLVIAETKFERDLRCGRTLSS